MPYRYNFPFPKKITIWFLPRLRSLYRFYFSQFSDNFRLLNLFPKDKSGHLLAELLLVLFILSLFSLSLIPHYRCLQRFHLKLQSYHFLQNIRLLQTECYASDKKEYLISKKWKSYPHIKIKDNIYIITHKDGSAEKYAFPADTKIDFNRSYLFSFELDRHTTTNTCTIKIKNAQAQHKITINSSGRVRLQ